MHRPRIPAPEVRPAFRTWLHDLLMDLRLTVRQLRRAPGTTAFIVLTLGIGIGANVTMVGVIDRLLLRPPEGVHHADRLARLVFVETGAPVVGAFTSYPSFLELERNVPAFESAAAFTSATLPYGTGAEAREVAAALVTASFFSTLRVRPALGRFFSAADGFPSDATPGGPAVAVISDGFWRHELGSDEGVLGRTLRVGKLTYTIVGVAPPGFRGLASEPRDLWLPMTVAADEEVRRFVLEDGSMSWLSIVARLRPDAKRELAQQQATAIARRGARAAAASDTALRAVLASVIRGRGPDAPREVKVALWRGGIATLVLLIACANIANLLLARAVVRRREIAVRLALGAGRGRLARQMLVDALLLATLGATVALILAALAGGALRRFFLSAEDATLPFVDGRLFAIAAAVTLGTAILVSLAPLTQSLSPDLTRALRTGPAGGGGRRSRLRAWLLGSQAALCTLLLIIAALFSQSLRQVRALDLGLDPDRTLVASFNLDQALMTRPERDATYAELAEQVRAIPGVARVAFAGYARAVNAHTTARNTDDVVRRTWDVPYETAVDSGYFRVLGSTLRGRDFTSSDVSGATKVTIINEPLARLLFPGEEPLGQCVYLPVRADDPDDECWTVVGVLTGFWYSRSILKREGLLAYVPLAQRRLGLGRPGRMVVAATGKAPALAPAIRRTILRVRPDIPRVTVRWMHDVIDPEVRPWRLAATMFSIFGIVALTVAGVGMYAVVSFSAVQRTSEIAVRIALGARGRNVLTTVAGNALRAVVAGIVIGLFATQVIHRWLGPLLFQTSPSDPGIMAGVALGLGGVGVAATLVPTARCLRRNPATILREEA